MGVQRVLMNSEAAQNGIQKVNKGSDCDVHPTTVVTTNRMPVAGINSIASNVSVPTRPHSSLGTLPFGRKHRLDDEVLQSEQTQNAKKPATATNHVIATNF